jgi:hypothetical protein
VKEIPLPPMTDGVKKYKMLLEHDRLQTQKERIQPIPAKRPIPYVAYQRIPEPPPSIFDHVLDALEEVVRSPR